MVVNIIEFCLATIFSVCVLQTYSTKMTMPGGLGECIEASAELQKMCDSIRTAAEEKAEKQFREFTAVSFCSQLVTGTKYLVKLHVGNNEYIHVSFVKKLPCYGGDLVLLDLQTAKTKEDPIEYF